MGSPPPPPPKYNYHSGGGGGGLKLPSQSSAATGGGGAGTVHTSQGGAGTLNQKGAGGGGWGASGGNTSTLPGGSAGAAIEVTYSGFNPSITGTGDGFGGATGLYGGIDNLGETAQAVFWEMEHNVIANNTNTTGWSIVNSAGGIIHWGDSTTDTFSNSFSGDHQY